MNMMTGDKTTNVSIGLNITIIILWSFTLLFTLVNSYLYLLKLSKYRFIPFMLLYTGLTMMCCVTITYYMKSFDLDDKVNTS